MKDWYRVENLEKQENSVYSNDEISDQKGDFESYKLMNAGADTEASEINWHNVTGDDAKYFARVIMDQIMKYKKRHNLREKERRLADLGGGLGFLAEALSEQIGEVYSYDISRDASEYGRKHFPKVRFVTKAIHEDDVFLEGPFDIVLANEFYPFTRTDDWKYQRGYMKMCLGNLKINGILIIVLADGKKGDREQENILRNRETLMREFAAQEVEISQMPIRKAYRLFKNERVARLVGTLGQSFVATRIVRNYSVILTNRC